MYQTRKLNLETFSYDLCVSFAFHINTFRIQTFETCSILYIVLTNIRILYCMHYLVQSSLTVQKSINWFSSKRSFICVFMALITAELGTKAREKFKRMIKCMLDFRGMWNKQPGKCIARHQLMRVVSMAFIKELTIQFNPQHNKCR